MAYTGIMYTTCTMYNINMFPFQNSFECTSACEVTSSDTLIDHLTYLLTSGYFTALLLVDLRNVNRNMWHTSYAKFCKVFDIWYLKYQIPRKQDEFVKVFKYKN